MRLCRGVLQKEEGGAGMMDLDSAIQHCKEQVQEQAKKGCYSCAEEHQQLAEWLKELKAYKDARAEINQALNDDARGEQNDYERGRKSGIFLCESIISVKLGESRSENPNTCGDAISRQAVMDYFRKWQPYMATRLWDYEQELKDLPSVTPQPRWIPVSERLPEDYIHVLCQFTLNGMGECYLAHGVFHVVGGLVMTCNEVIAWMPLPESYRESEE
jgi:hypothetical protein